MRLIYKVLLCPHVSIDGSGAAHLSICEGVEVCCEECGELDDVPNVQEVALSDLEPVFRYLIERSYNRQQQECAARA